MYKRVTGNLCDMDTGEVIEKQLYERSETKDGLATIKEKDFMKLSIYGTQRMVKVLTPTEISMVMGLVPYVSYTDCCIRRDGNGEIMNAQDIAKALDMDDAKVYRLIKSLEEKGVMGHHVTGSILPGYEGKVRKVYTVNPFIYFRGKKVNRAVYEFYLKSGWREPT